MPPPLGYHVVKTAYGRWLPGDERGSWSEAWSAGRGFYGAHQFHAGDEARRMIATARMRYAPATLTEEVQCAVEHAVSDCVNSANGKLRIIAAAMEPHHMHLLIAFEGEHPVSSTVRWLFHKATRKVHATTSHTGPVWVKNHWCGEIENDVQWDNAIEYIEQHNVRAGRQRRPYSFLTATRE